MRRRRVALFSLLGLSVVSIACPHPEPPPSRPTIPSEELTLPNGIRVLLHEDHQASLVVVRVAYHVGQRDDPQHRSELAHLVEHLMFRGTAHIRSGAFFETLESIGASNVNAETDAEETTFYETVPSGSLESALRLESDRMGYFLGGLDDESIETERDIVGSERREGIANVAYGRELIAAADILGRNDAAASQRSADLARITRSDIEAFHRTWYVPANSTIVLAGDFTPEVAKKLIERWFGSFPTSTKPVHPANPIVPLTVTAKVAVVDPFAAQRRVTYLWRSPGRFEPGDADLEMVSAILERHLARILIHEQNFADRVDAAQLGEDRVFRVAIDLREGADEAAVRRTLDAELDRLRNGAVWPGEFSVYLEERLAAFTWDVESLEARASELQLLGERGGLEAEIARYRRVNPGSMLRASQKYLLRYGRAELLTLPRGAALPEPEKQVTQEAHPPWAFPDATPQLLVFPDEEFRAAAPALGENLQKRPPIEKFTLENGLTVYLLEQHQKPVVRIEGFFPGGAATDADRLAGEASVCTTLLTREMAYDPWETFFSGSRFGSNAGPDEHWLVAIALKKNFDRTLGFWSNDLLHAPLGKRELAVVEAQKIAEDRRLRAAPRWLASRVAMRVLVGEALAKRMPTEGSLRSITREDCAAWASTNVRPSGAYVLVAGDITHDETAAKLSAALREWKGALPASSPKPTLSALEGRLFFVDVPQSTQAEVIAIEEGPPEDAPDAVATRILSAVLGQYFTSRLNANIRVGEGISYGALADFHHRSDLDFFQAQTSVRADSVGKALSSMAHEFQRVRDEEVPAAELDRAKSAVIQSLPALWLGSDEAIASYRELIRAGLPLEFWDGLDARVTATTAGDVLAAAKKHVDPAKMKFIVVGDRASLLPALRAVIASGRLGPGDLVLLDSEGQPVATDSDQANPK